MGGCSETLCPLPVFLLSHCQSAPTPGPPSPTPFPAEPGASPGSRRNRLQNARARSLLPPRAARRPPPRPAPVAQTPALRAQLSRPFRCSSQDGGRRATSRRGSPGPCQSTSLPEDRRRKRGDGRRGPVPACAPGAEKTRSPRTQTAPSPAGCGGGSARRGGPDAI